MKEGSSDDSINNFNPFSSFKPQVNRQCSQQSSKIVLSNGYRQKQGARRKQLSLGKTIINQLELEQLKIAMQKGRIKQKETKKRANRLGSALQQKTSTISNYRQRNIQRQFISKLTRNSIFRRPVQLQKYELNSHQSTLYDRNGIQIHEKLAIFFEILKLLTTIFTILMASFIIPFYSELETESFYKIYSGCGSFYTLFEIFMGFTFVHREDQKKTKLVEISRAYLYGNFFMDLLCFLAFFLSAVTSIPNISLVYVIFLLRIPECLRRINEAQTKIVNTFTMQNYVKLLKLIICNFTFAHFIAIIMLMMSRFDEGESWIQKSQFAHKWWFEQYSWAYYWAMTTMLSVGFGDITVANYKEALTFGCVTIGYNISSVIGLINSLEEKELEKNRNINLLKKIKAKNQIENSIYKKISNFIKQADEVDAKFNRQPIANLLQKLPENLQNSFLRSVNQRSIKNLPFFRHLHMKSLASIAQKIYTKVAHPEQILIQKEQMYNKILILKEGQIGLFPWFKDKSSSPRQFDRLVVKQGEASRMLNLNFLRPFYRPQNFQYRPIKYSLLLQTNLPNLLQILKSETADLQMYFQYRDKDYTSLEEYQVLDCQICKKEYENNQAAQELQTQKQRKFKQRHYKIQCPRLHYSPIAQQVIFKYLHLMKTAKVKRKKLCSLKVASKMKICGLKQYKKIIKESIQCTNVESLQIDQIFDSDDYSKNIFKPNRENPGNLASNVVNCCMENKANQWMQRSVNIKESTLRKKGAQIIPNFWDIQCDKAYDFKYYFTGFNPKKLAPEIEVGNQSNRYSFFTSFL